MRFLSVVIVVLIWNAYGLAVEPEPENLRKWLGSQTWIHDSRGPVLELGDKGAFDDMHMLTPLVALEDGKYRMWYSGSRDSVANRVFRLGTATSGDGVRFRKHAANPIFEFGDDKHSILTPTLLRDAGGAVLRENGKLRMWFSAAHFAGSGKHTLHESTSADGMHWSPPSPAQLSDIYAPTIIKDGEQYRMWYIDVAPESWTVRHASSRDGQAWEVSPEVCSKVDQPWEKGRLFYPTVLKIDGVYLMWYGSYWNKHSNMTALGLAVSRDGLRWIKNPHNPVLRPDASRPWESHYTTSQSVLRLSDRTWRIWYSTRKAPPQVNKYFAIGTARWEGPDLEIDDERLADAMPDPTKDRQAFERWQGETRASLIEMLGLPKRRVPLAPDSRGQVEHDGLTIETWTLQCEPNSRMPTILYRKENASGRMPAIVLTFGHGGSKSQPAYQYMAQLYAKLGFVVLAIDPIGEEERHAQGKLGTRAHDPLSVHQEAWQSGRPILGKMIWDSMRGVDYLLSRDDVDSKRIGVTGNSLGGALAGWMAVVDPRLRFSIVSGWAFDDVTVHFSKYCTRIPNLHMRRQCTWPQYLALAAPHCSLLVTNGDADVIIDRVGDGAAWRGLKANIAAAAKTYSALGNPDGATAWFEPGGGHRPYPAHPAAVAWLCSRMHPEGWTAEKIAALPTINFGRWTAQHEIKLERLYGVPLHQLGATVVDMDVRPLDRSQLACLRDDELGSAPFTLEGWLEGLKSGKPPAEPSDR